MKTENKARISDESRVEEIRRLCSDVASQGEGPRPARRKVHRDLQSSPITIDDLRSFTSTMKLSIAFLLSMVSLVSAENAALRDIITIGTRPYYLVEEMKDGELKNTLSEISKDST